MTAGTTTDTTVPTDPAANDRRAAPRLLFHQLGAVRGVAAAALAVLVVSVLATLAGPLLVQAFVDRATGIAAGRGSSESALVTIALAYLGVALLAGASRIAASYLGVQAGWRVADGLRVRLLRQAAVDRPVLEVESRPVGELLERVEGNADIVGRSIAESGFRLVGNIAVGVGTLVVMSTVVPLAGLGIALVAVPVCVLLNRLARRSVRRWEVAREQQAALFGFVGDSLAARDDLLPLGQGGWAAERTRRDLDELFGTESRAYLSGRLFWPVTQLVFALAFGLGFGFGLHQLERGAISVGTLTMIYLYVDLLQRPLEEMSSQAGQLQQMMAVLAIAARTLAPGEAARGTAELPPGPLGVRFEHVTFGYGDTPVVRDVSFAVEPGRSLGIVGPTGAGKSTVINLLCGLVRPSQGRVLIGGVDAGLLHPDQIARRLTVLSQRAHVFAATVRENVALFDPGVPDERIWAVLDRLGATRWVRELPEGLDTHVGAGARALSEGELQLLVGARAMVRPDSLLIVDEGGSRLDPETERSWAALLDTVLRDRTVIMVEHRLGVLRNVDELLVMEAGRVVEVGAR